MSKSIMAVSIAAAILLVVILWPRSRPEPRQLDAYGVPQAGVFREGDYAWVDWEFAYVKAYVVAIDGEVATVVGPGGRRLIPVTSLERAMSWKRGQIMM